MNVNKANTSEENLKDYKTAKEENRKQLPIPDTLVGVRTREVSVRNWFQNVESAGEFNRYPSLTQPDMTLSMREILERFSRGQGISVRQDHMYEEEDFTELEKLDKFERMDLKKQNAAYVEELRNEIAENQKKAVKPTPPLKESEGSEDSVDA